MNLVEKQWLASEKPIVIRFNPWLIKDAEHLIEYFLVELSSKISLDDPTGKAKDIAEKLNKYSQVFNVLRYFPDPAVTLLTTVLEATTKTAGKTFEDIAKLKERNIEQKKNDVIHALKEYKKPIVVMVDDIDRLAPSEVYEIIRLVKAIGDFPRTSYLLAFDPAYVERVLRRRGISKQDTYLDKIIQLRTRVPLISKDDLQVLLDEILKRLPSEYEGPMGDENKYRVAELYNQYGLRQIIESPRDVKKIMNRVRFNMVMLGGEVTLADELALAALAIKAPPVYHHITICPDAYTGKVENDIFSKSEDVLKRYEFERQEALDKVASKLKQWVSKLLEFLFPHFQNHIPVYPTEHYSQRGRVMAPDRLRIALSCGLPTGEFALSRVHEFVKSPESRSDLVNNLPEGNELSLFLNRLNEAVLEGLNVEDVAGFIIVLAEIASDPKVEKLDNDSRQNDILLGGVFLRFTWLLLNVLEGIPEDRRRELCLPIFGDVKYMNLATEVIHSLLLWYGQIGEQKKDGAKLIFHDRDIDEFKKNWLNATKPLLENRKILSLHVRRKVLFMLIELEPEYIKKIIPGYLLADEDFDGLLGMLIPRGVDSAKGEYIQKIDEDYLAKAGLEIEQVKKRIKERQESNGPIEDQLKTIHKSILTGKSSYFIDGSEPRH